MKIGSPGKDFCRATALVAMAGGAPALLEQEHEHE
jgi:hypothetical protein